MGLLLGVLFSRKSNIRKGKYNWKSTAVPVLAITTLFIAGRLVQYLIFDIYSSFHTKTNETLIWCICTGLIVACSLAWLRQYIIPANKFIQAITLGLLFFGLNLTLFNFFMPLVFDANIFDLVLRTAIDIISLSVGCLFFKVKK